MYIFYNFWFRFLSFYVIFTIYSLFIHFLFIFHSYVHAIVKLHSRERSRLYRRYVCNNITHIDKFFHNSLRCTRRRGHSSFLGIFKHRRTSAALSWQLQISCGVFIGHSQSIPAALLTGPSFATCSWTQSLRDLSVELSTPTDISILSPAA